MNVVSRLSGLPSRRSLLLLVLGLTLHPAGFARADGKPAASDSLSPIAPDDAIAPEDDGLERTLAMKTLGGRQFWGDVSFLHGWKIQQNIVTGHYRLLDPKDYRFSYGTLKTCQQRMKEIREQLKMEPMDGRAVISLHGIIRSSKSFSKMNARMRKEGFTVVPFDYPSTRADLDACADYLDHVIRSLDGIDEINFVTHSMGGLVVRAWLKKHKDPRATRLVMIGTPNNGAELASLLKSNRLFQLVLGPAGQQLVTGDDSVIARLPTPRFPFAVIAGSRGTESGYNPLIPGDDDGTVAVSSTRLRGAADSMTIKAIHSFLPFNDDVIAATACFFKKNSLRESGECQPVPNAQRDSR